MRRKKEKAPWRWYVDGESPVTVLEDLDKGTHVRFKRHRVIYSLTRIWPVFAVSFIIIAMGIGLMFAPDVDPAFGAFWTFVGIVVLLIGVPIGMLMVVRTYPELKPHLERGRPFAVGAELVQQFERGNLFTARLTLEKAGNEAYGKKPWYARLFGLNIVHVWVDTEGKISVPDLKWLAYEDPNPLITLWMDLYREFRRREESIIAQRTLPGHSDGRPMMGWTEKSET